MQSLNLVYLPEKKSMEKLDLIDLQLLRLLQKDAQKTHKEIAGQLHLSVTPVYERIKRLEKQGFINKYVALLDKDKINKSLVAYCNVSLKEHAQFMIKKFEKEVLKFKEVVECYNIAGQFDYLLKVMVKDMKEYQHFITNKLAVLDNIGNTQSMFVMNEIKYSTELPVEK
jgi:Lrp/AsnC family leucine-responsive transcriptional regulator